MCSECRFVLFKVKISLRDAVKYICSRKCKRRRSLNLYLMQWTNSSLYYFAVISVLFLLRISQRSPGRQAARAGLWHYSVDEGYFVFSLLLYALVSRRLLEQRAECGSNERLALKKQPVHSFIAQAESVCFGLCNKKRTGQDCSHKNSDTVEHVTARLVLQEFQGNKVFDLQNILPILKMSVHQDWIYSFWLNRFYF